MNTKLIMTVSALLMGVLGLVLTFIPAEVLHHFNGGPSLSVAVIALQMIGALYFGFAMINWTAKANLIGGIYSRPIAIGNLTHFFIGAMALMRSGNLLLIPLTITYSVMAAAFFIVFVTHPVKSATHSVS